jgi:hypothetical protein
MKSTTVNAVAAAITKVAKATGVPVMWLAAFARIESNFNPYAVNGQSRGLFQMQKGAWEDTQKFVRLPSYDKYWQEPFYNTLSAAVYIKINLDRLARYGYNASSEPRWIYLAHQQGVAGLLDLLAAASGQEVENPRVTREAMKGNRAPGSLLTYDLRTFYENWMEYLTPYFDGDPFTL